MALVQHYPALKPEAAPVCSVCIANYNGMHMLADCLDSVLAQSPGNPVEIIVHDDASTDDSVAFLREHYPQVEILASADNVGFCIGNNRMVAHARGEYVLLLNNDAALDAGALQVLLAEAARIGGDAILSLPQRGWETGTPVDRGCLLDPFYNPAPNLDVGRQEVAYVIGACLWIPRRLWRELGGFPEWFGSLAEDMYLCCAARLRGVPVRCIDGSGYRHRQGASFGGNRVDGDRLKSTYRRRALSERNKSAVLAICTPTPVVWPLLALHLILLAGEGVVLALLKRDARLWHDIYGVVIGNTFRSIGTLWSRRRKVQASRRVSLHKYWGGFVWWPRKLSLLWRHGVPHIR
jgi:GT2 family glycosyltransferase